MDFQNSNENKANQFENSSHEGALQQEFIARHIGVTARDAHQMCESLKVADLEQLIEEVIPQSILSQPQTHREAHSESATLNRLREIAAENKVFRTFIGQGFYGSLTPGVVLRNVLENPAWYTAYTPYQPEISQGRLEALLNYQTMISDLTGFEIANASLLDESSAAGEAMAFCYRNSKSKSKKFFASRECHPQTIEVLKTRCQPLGIELVVGDHTTDLNNSDFFGVLLQYPASCGEVYDYRDVISSVKETGAMVVMAADLLSLTLLTPPGELGADVAVGTSQRFGIPLFYGGPHAAYFATRSEFKRSVPGRIIGVSKDAHGKPALRMALQTREQHIRRDKATSNVCTAQALLAMCAGFYAMYHGPDGLREIATRTHAYATLLANALRTIGCTITNQHWFDTLTVEVENATAIVATSQERQVNFREIDQNTLAISLDETTTREDLRLILSCFLKEDTFEFGEALELLNQATVDTTLPESLERKSDFLQHAVFNEYQTETAMLRYLRQLADKDLALDRTMIPLGSCTMKLNATTEMLPISWPEFANLHPFVPASQARGYQRLIADLEDMLTEITGYDAVSLQPNAGSQGEFAGLLAIQAYHANRGEGHRNICLIPESAHGTNPASAKMSGLEIVVVRCDEEGNVDLDDLESKADKHAANLSCMMITYPSTHGVFEQNVQQLCEVIHQRGGQVYIDGANLNAQVGLCEPGKYGGDVSHLNLHKTFCIPHGGGGPGVGPVAVRSHLAPYLPKANFRKSEFDPAGNNEPVVGPVCATPFGSAGILPISWAYIHLMGSEGLTQASRIAILNANYIATRLNAYFPVLYSGQNGRVAHECILDLRPLTEESGVTVDDVAKRLIDYGFHAPTMSFPVPGTLMVEPTESENLLELDRFCDAMIQIRKEIDKVIDGSFIQNDNPLSNAPHTAATLMENEWNRSYERSYGGFPSGDPSTNKYWPPVGRLDHAYGDRNLFCTCPSITDEE